MTSPSSVDCLYPGSGALLNTQDDANYQNEEVIYNGHLSQSKFKSLPFKSFLTVMRELWHIKATTEAGIDIIFSYSVMYQQVHVWRAILQMRFICLLV